MDELVGLAGVGNGAVGGDDEGVVGADGAVAEGGVRLVGVAAGGALGEGGEDAGEAVRVDVVGLVFDELGQAFWAGVGGWAGREALGVS